MSDEDWTTAEARAPRAELISAVLLMTSWITGEACWSQGAIRYT